MKCPNCSIENPSGQTTCFSCHAPMAVDLEVLRDQILDGATDIRAERLVLIFQFVITGLALLNLGLLLWNKLQEPGIIADISDAPAIPVRVSSFSMPPPRPIKVPQQLVKLPLPDLSPPGPHSLAHRHPGQVRQALLELRGGAGQTQVAVNRGLNFLARQFRAREGNLRGHVLGTGANPGSNRTGLTSLVVLAMLANGHTGADASTRRRGSKSPYALHVETAIQWLLAKQLDSGQYGPPAAKGPGGNLYVMTQHGIATLAIVEAYAMTGKSELRQSARRALEFIVNNQLDSGAWFYLPKSFYKPDESKMLGETTVSGWQVMALVQAKKAGLRVPAAPFQRVADWLDRVSETATGLVGDDRRPDSNDKITRTPVGPTAVALMVRLAMGGSVNQTKNAKALRFLIDDRFLPVWEEDWTSHEKAGDDLDLYYFYHGTYALTQVGGQAWARWYPLLEKALLGHMQHRGQGTNWPHIGRFHEVGGTVYSTALAVLALSAPYRYVE